MFGPKPVLASAQSILGSTEITPATVKAGEIFLVEVKAPDGSSYPDNFDRISIGGLITPRRYMSFRSPGDRVVLISARHPDGTHERTRVSVEVLPTSVKLPSLEIEPSLEDGAHVQFVALLPGKQSQTDDEQPGSRWRRALAGLLDRRLPRARQDDVLPRKEQSKLAESARSLISKAAENASHEAAARFVAAAAHAAVLQVARITQTSGGTRTDPQKAGAAAAKAAAAAVLASAHAATAHVPPTSDNDLPATTYTWDFGTGPSVSTTSPSFGHDFEQRLDPTRPRTAFHVKVVVHEPGASPFELRRTISVTNPYHPSRVKGVVRPIVRSDVNATLVMDSPRHYRASLEIMNLENEALTLTRHRFEPLYLGDPPGSQRVSIESSDIGNLLRTHLDVATPPMRAVARTRFYTSRPLPGAPSLIDVTGDWVAKLVAGLEIAIQAGATQKVEVRLPDDALPKEAVGFAVHYRGVTTSGKQVRASAYFDVPGRFRRLDAIDSSVALTLNTLQDHGLLAKRGAIPVGDLVTLVRRSAVPASLSRSAVQRAVSPVDGSTGEPSDQHGSMIPLSGNTDEIFQGNPCDPYNLPSVIPEGWVCQATSEKEWRWVPPRFVNARQGDIIVSPGGDGLIAQLLRQVDPPQDYAHSGIMSRNQSEVTHSTASEIRLLAYPNGWWFIEEPTDGLQPNALRFLWPGVVKQTVEHAVDGQAMTDPEGEVDENGDNPTYTITGFNPDFSGTFGEIVPALVVKPDPFEETSEIRAKLREVGAFASEQHGRGHYRFFAYTDPTVVLSQLAPESAGWAAGTYPCVCSSFVWFCARTQQVAFEGSTLEPDDLAVQVKVDLPGSGEDGLYRYTAAERLAAGEFIYQWLYDMVWDQADGLLDDFGIVVSDTAEDVANQILNTFESDWAETDAKDSEAWKDTSDADAVSPDNILRWDGPSAGGLWGSSEPLIYRTARYEYLPKHVWKKVDKVGSFHGTVLFEQQAVEAATIELSGGQFAAFSDGEGTFSFVGIPVGLYQLTAYKVVDDQGTFQSTNGPMDIEIKEGDQDVVVYLSGPNPDYREVVYDVNITVKDYEFAAAADPHRSESYEGVAHIGPSDPFVELGPFSCLCDNDVLAEGFIDLEWKPDRTVRYRRRLRLHDGSEPSDKAWNYASDWKTLAPGQNKSGSTSIGDMSDSEDAAKMWTTLKNNVDMS